MNYKRMLFSSAFACLASMSCKGTDFQDNEYKWKFLSGDVDISGRDVADEPLSGELVSISVIDDSVSDLNDTLIDEKSLITNIFTDNNGQINITLEVPDSVNKLLLEVHALGIENEVIFNIDESALVMHNF